MKFETFFIDRKYEYIYYYLKDQGFSEAFISSLRTKRGLILKNDEIANTRTPLEAGDILSIAMNTRKKSSFKTNTHPLEIVFEDEYLLIVNKPAGLTTSPSRSHYDENLAGAVLNYMLNKDPDFVVRIVNRLDKDTAGLVIIAKDAYTYSKLKDVKKKYYAVCEGEIEHNIILDFPIETISNNGINQIRRIVSPLGKPAKTFVTPIKHMKNSTLLEITLENGRTHQIRVHLSYIGHPLIGDEIYGQKSDRINNTALICKEISFTHPKTGEKIQLEIDFPADFKSLIE